MPTMIGSSEIGGGFVRLGFTDSAGRFLKAGTRLTADEINAMGNRRTLISVGKIAVFPPAKEDVPAHATRHVVHNGGGRFDVIAGVKLNTEILNREEAEALAARSD